MYPIILALILSSVILGDTWDFVVPALFALNLWLSYMFKSKEKHSA